MNHQLNPANFVEISQLSFKRDGRSIFDRLDLVVKKGAITAVMGPSGSGKTTLVNLLMRFYYD